MQPIESLVVWLVHPGSPPWPAVVVERVDTRSNDEQSIGASNVLETSTTNREEGEKAANEGRWNVKLFGDMSSVIVRVRTDDMHNYLSNTHLADTEHYVLAYRVAKACLESHAYIRREGVETQREALNHPKNATFERKLHQRLAAWVMPPNRDVEVRQNELVHRQQQAEEALRIAEREASSAAQIMCRLRDRVVDACRALDAHARKEKEVNDKVAQRRSELNAARKRLLDATRGSLPSDTPSDDTSDDREREQEACARQQHEPPFRCEQAKCGRAFASKQGLKLHAVWHRRLMFACTKGGCARRFRTSAELRAHMREHDGWRCTSPGCARVLTTKAAWVNHTKAHKGRAAAVDGGQ